MTKKLLMCTPKYYDVEYVINPWMNLDNKVDKTKAQNQWEDLITVLNSCGVDVEVIEGVAGLPDMTFAGDAGIMFDGVFLASNFKYPQRQKEREHYITWIKKHNYIIREVPKEIYFEGLGDVVVAGKKVVCGHGPRSHREAFKWIRKTFPQLDIAVELPIKDELFFHLAMAAGPLDEDTIIYCERAFFQNDVDNIKKKFKNAIAANEIDVMENIICNNIVVGRKIICHDCSKELEDLLNTLNFEIIRCDVSEFKKSGASLRCLVLNLE